MFFFGLKNTEFTRNQDYKLQLEGPVWKNHVTFFTNFRYQNNLGHINGIRRFRVEDYTDFVTPNYIEEETPWDAYINGVRYYYLNNRAFKVDYAYRDLGMLGKLHAYTLSLTF